ncbi:formin-like protein 6 [Actinidia eriantha]|uniref:formin-like protein 6 n=1 Tax=Actinidia eriantha TaxID=165200 RepID=UPI0025842379|nr:formin-like protein 6 [Actinidia eriantha]
MDRFAREEAALRVAVVVLVVFVVVADEEEVEEEELFLWLCIHTLKTCLLTPTPLQNRSISSPPSSPDPTSLLRCAIFHPIFSANPSIFSLCSAVNFVLNRFLPLPPPAAPSSSSSTNIPPLPQPYRTVVTTDDPRPLPPVTLRWKLRWQPQAAHWRLPPPGRATSSVNSPQPSVA